jgi:hypothetical protein
MNSSPEDFEQLRRLLALKRHEQPPPGYFDHFSDKVIARIEAEGLVIRPSWWQRLFPELDARPVLACAYGLVIVGLLVVGLGASQTLEPTEVASPVLATPWLTPTPMAASLTPMDPSARQVIVQNDAGSGFTPVVSSTAPSFLFDVNRLKAEGKLEPVAYPLR